MKLSKSRSSRIPPEDLIRGQVESGHVAWITPTVGRGIVLKIYEKCVTMRMDTAFIRAYWFRQILPPDVVVGARITVVGDLCSCMAQERYYLRNCLLIPEGYANLKREMYKIIEQHTLKPAEYMTTTGELKG